MEGTRKSLPANAYRPLQDGEKYEPYVPASQSLPEASGRAIFWGLLMAAVFTAAAAYLGLKIGQVFEAAIPIAILAVGLAGLYARRNTVLENVIIQSIGAASGVIVAGAIFTIPALYILHLQADFFQIFLASLFGGFLGILFLIPLRRYFVAEQHGHLPFPEATATTEVLVTGESGGAQAVVLLIAAAVGGIYDFLIATFGMWSEVISTRLVPWGAALADKAKLVLKLNAGAAVMGLGYIIGLRYASIICAGSFVSWLVLIPITWYFGQHLDSALLPGNVPLAQMSAEQIFTSYIRHIGIGGIACAGIIGIIKNLKIIVQAFTTGFKEIFAGKGGVSARAAVRTDRDIPMSVLVVLLAAVTVCILVFFRAWVVTSWLHAVAALVLALAIAFLFTTVAARATAIVGVNPVSGMTLMTLIISSVILVKLGLSGTAGMLSALLIGTVVCTALSTAGGFITDLKIGYWLGSTPFNQERLKFMGVLVASLAVGGVVLLLNKVYGFVPSAEHPSPMAAPQANAMAAVLNVLFTSSQVPWGLYGAGVFMALTLELLGVPPLAFALGMYLPIELNTPLIVGGLIAHWVAHRSTDEALNTARREKGTLIASGFIAGGSIMGVVSAVLALVAGNRLHVGLAETTVGNWHVGMIVSLVLFVGLCLFLYRYAMSAKVQR
ncbi:MAG: oligopeptide transporter, OPT family [candidate division KSB1 bacterium]|nr:oligopeptide transporter, OPT family [candidate division KSB1 bacterium]MDZ7294132.1 oligopeptide transporter, OPT family [candidate division KSB1 bacterium]